MGSLRYMRIFQRLVFLCHPFKCWFFPPPLCSHSRDMFQRACSPYAATSNLEHLFHSQHSGQKKSFWRMLPWCGCPKNEKSKGRSLQNHIHITHQTQLNISSTRLPLNYIPATMLSRKCTNVHRRDNRGEMRGCKRENWRRKRWSLYESEFCKETEPVEITRRHVHTSICIHTHPHMVACRCVLGDLL